MTKPVALYFTPGMSRGVLQSAEPLRSAGYDVRYVSIPGRSAVFVQLVQECGAHNRPILPCILERYAPDVDPRTPVVAATCFSAGCWAITEGLLVHPADRARLDAVLFVDGYHAKGQRMERMRAALDEGLPALVIHSDTQTPPSYPSTTESVELLKPWPSSLTVVHAPGGHDWRTLHAGEHIADYLGVPRPEPYATYTPPSGPPGTHTPPPSTPADEPELGLVERGGPFALMLAIGAAWLGVRGWFRRRGGGNS